MIGAAAAIIALASAANCAVNVEKTKYSIYGECYSINNGVVEVIATKDIGPRVIAYKFIGGTNILGELDDKTSVKTDLGVWHPWGGHRLWHAPESMPRTYSPDDGPVTVEVVGGNSVRLIEPVEPATHIQKEIEVTLDANGTGVTLTHKLANEGLWPVELAPWALTIVNGGGLGIIPQEPFIRHEDKLLPARPMVLWNYTDLTDPRWKFGKKYITLRCDSKLEVPQKIGVGNKQGWAGYLREGTLFINQFPYSDAANYPDYGCNYETYTAGSFMELESIGPMVKLAPKETTTYIERWNLFKGIEAGSTEESLDKAITPILKQIERK